MRKSPQRVFTAVLTALFAIGYATVAYSQEKAGSEPVTKMKTGGEVIEQVNVIDEMIGTIDWENNVVYAVGDGVMPKDAISPAQGRVRAKRAAIDEAYGRLLELVNQVRVDAESLTRNFVNENRVVRTKVSGMIKNAEIEKLRQLDDGSFQIKMRMPMLGRNGISSAIFPVRYESVRKVGIVQEVSRGGVDSTNSISVMPPKNEESTPDKSYTSLIIDAKGLNAKPSLYPKIISESGKAIYNISVADPNATIEEGLCSYRKSLDAAKSLSRSGTHPLIIKASRLSGKYGADLVISDRDAERIQSANAQVNFLNDANVIVVVD